MLAEKEKKAVNTSSSTNHIKRNSSLLDRLFSPRTKRARIESTTSNDTKMVAKKTTKPSLDKSRRKEVKKRLNDEASKEIRPLAVGTMAMMASALANQGELCANVCYNLCVVTFICYVFIISVNNISCVVLRDIILLLTDISLQY